MDKAATQHGIVTAELLLKLMEAGEEEERCRKDHADIEAAGKAKKVLEEALAEHRRLALTEEGWRKLVISSQNRKQASWKQWRGWKKHQRFASTEQGWRTLNISSQDGEQASRKRPQPEKAEQQRNVARLRNPVEHGGNDRKPNQERSSKFLTPSYKQRERPSSPNSSSTFHSELKFSNARSTSVPGSYG